MPTIFEDMMNVKSSQPGDTPTVEALNYLTQAWQALETLEASLPEELARWDAESLMTARKGTRRAWLALSNLNRSLNARWAVDGKKGRI
jgi:hypothetical protein